jgi:molybdenum-dependent DNA-binding transcriptional regulator ModE
VSPHLLECESIVLDQATVTLSTDMLDAFVKVAAHLSVSAAAQELGVSKSVVSKRVAQLEQAVRATLFSRSTRRIALTLLLTPSSCATCARN